MPNGQTHYSQASLLLSGRKESQMAQKTLRFRITGETLLMHNGQLADPLNEWAKAMKKVSSKRTKTDADHEELARLEWCGGLYLHEGRPCVPAECLAAALTEGAKVKRLGKETKRSLFVPGVCMLHFAGEEDWDGSEEAARRAWDSGVYTHRHMVKVKMNRVARTRPIFRDWWVEFDLEYDDARLNETEVREIVQLAGQNGLMDWRPRYGRFDAEMLKPKLELA